MAKSKKKLIKPISKKAQSKRKKLADNNLEVIKKLTRKQTIFILYYKKDMANFDLRNFLTENKLNRASKALSENIEPKKLNKLSLGAKTYQVGDNDPNDEGKITTIEKFKNLRQLPFRISEKGAEVVYSDER